jgi:hypothetical protein
MPDVFRDDPEGDKPGEPLREQEHRLNADSPQDDDVYGFSEHEAPPSESPTGPAGPSGSGPADAGGAPAGGSAGWYMATPGGQPDGPLDFDKLRRRVTSGHLREADVVWREGMPNWVAARDVRGLFGGTAAGPPPIPPQAPAGRSAPSVQPDQILRGINALFSRPSAYRAIGRISALLAAVVFLFSVLMLVLSTVMSVGHLRWFTGVLMFAAIFLVCEAAGAILDTLQRRGTGAQRPDGGGENTT